MLKDLEHFNTNELMAMLDKLMLLPEFQQSNCSWDGLSKIRDHGEFIKWRFRLFYETTPANQVEPKTGAPIAVITGLVKNIKEQIPDAIVNGGKSERGKWMDVDIQNNHSKLVKEAPSEEGAKVKNKKAPKSRPIKEVIYLTAATQAQLNKMKKRDDEIGFLARAIEELKVHIDRSIRSSPYSGHNDYD